MKESVIQSSIISYLKKIKLCYVLRVSTTGVFDPVKKRFRKNQQQKGTSDILLFIKSRCVAIEVKTPQELKFITKHYERISNIKLCKTARDYHVHDQIMFIEGLKKTGNSGFFTDSISHTKNKLIEIFKNEKI